MRLKLILIESTGEKMKRITFAASLIVTAVIAFGVGGWAQSSKADPVKVDARHYKVELENDSVRVLRISYKPGEKSVMHSHPNAVAVYLSNSTMKMTTPDGKSEDITAKVGGASWTPAGSHLPQNIGGTPAEVVLVELKK